MVEPLPVLYLQPILVRRQIVWPHDCEEQVQTPLVKQWRTQHARGHKCVRKAKIDFRGKKLCFMHAQIAALDELAGPEPEITLTQLTDQ
jgi:hypothetical protein